MSALLRSVLVLSAFGLALAGCDEVAAYDQDPDVRADNLANLKCARAVTAQTGVAGTTPNTTIPVVEANQYIINVPGSADTWTCLTDSAGTPTQLYKTRV